MDLNAIEEVARPKPGDGTIDWRDGDAWLAGGTWLFSEPQPHLRRLIDLQGLGWEPLTVSDRGLEIAATCEIAKLDALTAPADWTAAPLIGECCRSFLSSFKIWNTATVGGNVCMSLPAGPMISLTAALEGVCTILAPRRQRAPGAVVDFVTGNHQNVLQPGDLLRSIDLPASALRKRTAFRRMSLTHLGRSTALLIGTLDPRDGIFVLTVSAATVRPASARVSETSRCRTVCARASSTRFRQLLRRRSWNAGIPQAHDVSTSPKRSAASSRIRRCSR